MTDDRHEEPLVDHSTRAAPPADGAGNAMIRREKSTDALSKHRPDSTPLEAIAERHRAWLRQAARRAR